MSEQVAKDKAHGKDTAALELLVSFVGSVLLHRLPERYRSYVRAAEGIVGIEDVCPGGVLRCILLAATPWQ